MKLTSRKENALAPVLVAGLVAALIAAFIAGLVLAAPTILRVGGPGGMAREEDPGLVEVPDAKDADLGEPATDRARIVGDAAEEPLVESIGIADAAVLELEVLALRADGKPAPGLGVALRMTLPDGTTTASSDVAVTDAAGRASFPWKRVVLLGAHLAGVGAHIVAGERVVATFEPVPLTQETALPLMDATGNHVRLGPPVEPVVIQLPPTASIEVRTWLAPDEPFLLSSQARLMSSLESGLPRDFAYTMVKLGTGRFECVDPEASYELQVTGSIPWKPVNIDGPLGAGSVLQVDVFPSPSSALYEARLVSGTGDPLSDFHMKLRLSQRNHNARVVSDPDGRILFGFPSGELGTTWAVDVIAESWRVDTGQPLVLNFPAASAGQRVDLGDIVLDEPVPWYSGSVVDVTGAPVANANVALDFVKRQPVQSQGEQQRTMRRASSTNTDEQGRFWLPAPEHSLSEQVKLPDKTLQLSARAFYVRSAFLEVDTQPLSGIRLVLSPLREVSVLVSDVGSSTQPLVVMARRTDDPNAEPQFFGRRLGSPGFRANLPAGTWRLSLYRGPYNGLPILESAPFVVETPTAAESVSPKELQLEDLSLAGRWRECALRFEDEDGMQIRSVELTLKCASMQRQGAALAYGDEDFELVLPSEPVTITAKANRYRERTFTLLGTQRTIVLEAKGN